MALPDYSVVEVHPTGSNTNGGGFSVNRTMATDGAVSGADTSAPVISSASYSFQAGDVGAWLFISAGTNAVNGWYKIASVASGAATIDAAIGHAVVFAGMPSTAVGCGTAATLTSVTWTVDYSQGDAGVALSSLATVSPWTTITCSAATPAWVGNFVHLNAVGSFTSGWYCITSVTAGTSFVVDRACATADSSGGTGTLGGALATPNGAATVVTFDCSRVFISGTHTISSDANFTQSDVNVMGYGSIRGDGVHASLIAGADSLSLAHFGSGARHTLSHVDMNGNGHASITGMYGNAYAQATDCIASNCATGFGGSALCYRCRAENCSTGYTVPSDLCVAYNCGTGFSSQTGFSNCIAIGGTTGFTSNGYALICRCIAYGQSGNGFDNSYADLRYVGCIAAGCGGVGFERSFNYDAPLQYINCFAYACTGGSVPAGTVMYGGSTVATLSVSPFTDAPNGNFGLSNDPNGGALCRAALTDGFVNLPNTHPYSDAGAVQHPDPTVVFPAAGSIYAGKIGTIGGVTKVTGTLHASNISGPDAANGGENLSASILGSGHVVDDVTGSLTGGGGGMGGIFETIVR
jgi:hypothetical protein